ncbi:MAG: YqaJ viral recombinase family protein [Patescibacteria group bacterium]|nr:YqaJ viral recombinase family protein [Patescibacteria group bacterium]
MKILDVEQNTSAWLDARKLSHGTASELSAAAGKSKYISRDKLLKQKSIGLADEIDQFTQQLFDKGHAAEYAARSLAEEIAGGELYPMTATIDVDGLVLLASFDGISMDETVIFEHKLFNKTLSENVVSGTLDEHYTLQMDQQLLISGADKCLFMCSDGTKDNMVYCWYKSTPEKLANVVNIWKQFHADLAMYSHEHKVEQPKAAPIKDLPAVIVQVSGTLTRCNIDDVRPQFDKFLTNALIDLVTDEDFAQAEAESKIGRETAKRCLLTAKSVVDQTLTISEVTRELENYAAKFNAIALKQEKAVKEQKEARKITARREHEKAFSDHVFALNEELKPITLICKEPDWNGAMKNQRLLSSLYNKLDVELATAKMNADAIAKDIRGKLSWFNDCVTATRFLFNDLQSIITSNNLEAFQSIVKSRISDYAKEQEAKAEAQRKRIQEEEQRKAEAEQAKKLEAERAAIREEERVKAEAEAKRIRDEQAELARIEKEKLKAEKQADFDKLHTINNEFALKISQKEVLSSQSTLSELRSSADRIEAAAQYADRSEDRHREMASAINLRKQADELERLAFSNKLEIEPTITITVAEHKRLLDGMRWLECLREAEVGTWTGYRYARALYSKAEMA